MNSNTYIIGGLRTAIGSISGGLSEVRADDMMALVLKNLLEKYPSVSPDAIADVIIGCANQAGEDNRNVARMASLLAGIPYSVPAETVNRLCASGMASVIHAHRAIQSGDGDLFISGGVEQMTRAPYVMSKPSSAYGRDSQMFDTSFGWRFVNPKMKDMFGTDAMGETAENLAELYNISRDDQDKFAVLSQQKAFLASSNGRFDEEICPVIIPQRKADAIIFEKDEFIKGNSNLESLGKLRPAFRSGGTVTAGNASGLNDGAAAVLLASDEGIRNFDLKPIARICASAVVGVEPRIMGIGPVEASRLALKKAGLTMDDMDIIELNEAFAAQVLACTRNLGLEDVDPRINPNGGAIALGHPLGMSGTRLILTAALELNKQNKRYALCTMCIGVGQGYAVIIERV